MTGIAFETGSKELIHRLLLAHRPPRRLGMEGPGVVQVHEALWGEGRSPLSESGPGSSFPGVKWSGARRPEVSGADATGLYSEGVPSFSGVDSDTPILSSQDSYWRA